MAQDFSPDELDFLVNNLELLEPHERAEVQSMIDTLSVRGAQDDAQNNFLSFMHTVEPSLLTGPQHKIIGNAFERICNGTLKRVIINIAPRHALRLGTLVPTVRGAVAVEDLCVGDKVFGPDGLPIAVTGKSDVFQGRELYRAWTDDGAFVDVDGEHLWTVRLHRKYGAFKEYTTEQLWYRQNGAFLRTKRGGEIELNHDRRCTDIRLPMLPEFSPVQHSEKALAVDPYVLGVWLGDGHSSCSRVTMMDTDFAIVGAEMVRRGYVVESKKHKYLHLVRGLSVLLRQIGVLNNKHIPEQYLMGSVQQRRDLLKGLMDTDGNVSEKGQCFFAQSRRPLIDQVAALIRSLGIKANVIETNAVCNGKDLGKAWKVSFYANDIAHLPRKEVRTLKDKRHFGRYLKVEKLHTVGSTQCISVDREDGLFLAGDGYVVTHNSKSTMSSYLLPAFYLGKFPAKKIIMASHTGDLAVDFGRKVRNLVASPIYGSVFPNVSLAADSKAAGRWNTQAGGEYYALGVGAAMAGRGGDLVIIDDPHALPLDTAVPTPDRGFLNIGLLRVGDYVFGPDGKPTKVLAKSDVYHDRELYSVTTDDGEVVPCDGGHLWSYRSDTKLSAPQKTATARELAQWDKTSKPCMPRHSAAQYPQAILPIEPYVLGAWLGDGTSSLGRMTSHPDDAPFMRAQFHAAGYITTDLADAYSFGVLKLREQLITERLLNNKHIPEAYLTASVEQRMALLQGLMDTDGNVTTAGQCCFQNTNLSLAVGVRQILHSLGVKAKLHTYFDARERHATRKPDHRVTFKLLDAARMPRKRERTFTPTDKQCRSFVVEKTSERADVQCITVDRADGLFLVGHGYVVTHNSEQEARSGNPAIFDSAYEWYQSGPRQRLQPGGAIVVLMTRWNKRDLSGRLVENMIRSPDGDEWEVIELPAIMPSGLPLWPEFWSLEELLRTKASMDPRYWQAQYMQNPVADEGALIKGEWWRPWLHSEPPECEYLIAALDAAAETNNRADHTALVIMGVFYREDEASGERAANIILLECIRERMEFPELKDMAYRIYKEWRPDCFIVEKKSSGVALYQEMRRAGVPVSETTPHRGSGDKTARLNAVADIVRAGLVWYPEGVRWAEELIAEVSGFPSYGSDDRVDCLSMILARFRAGGFIKIPTDRNFDEDEADSFRPVTRKYY